MKYSIIIPVYNVARFLPTCVESVFNQTFVDYEILLIDDGSTENSGLICDDFAKKDSRVKVFHRKNQGVSAARNYGVSQAQGEYILFLDADDYYTDQLMLEKIDRKIQQCDMVVFGVVGSIGNHLMKTPLPYSSIDGLKSTYESGEAFLEEALRKNPGYMWWPWRYVFKRFVWNKNQISFPEGVTFCEDAATIYKAILALGKVSVIKEPFYAYRQQRNGAATNNVNFSKNMDQLNVAENEITYINRLNSISEKVRRLLCCNLAMGYYAVLIRSTKYSAKEREVCWNELERAQWIAKYTATPKQVYAYRLLTVLGVPFTAHILGIRRRLKYGK